MSEIFTIKKINVWKNQKGTFIVFEERPETFYYFDVKPFLVGDKVEITSSAIPCGDIKDSKRIDTISVVGTVQKTIPFNSPIAEAQRSTGAKLNTPVGPADASGDFLIHQLLAKQAEEILNTKAVIEKLLKRIEELERDNKLHFTRENILQNSCKVSFI